MAEEKARGETSESAEERTRRIAEEQLIQAKVTGGLTEEPATPAAKGAQPAQEEDPDLANMTEGQFRSFMMKTLMDMRKDTKSVAAELGGVKSRVNAIEISRSNSKQSKRSPSVTSGQLDTDKNTSTKTTILHPKPTHAVSPTKLKDIEEKAEATNKKSEVEDRPAQGTSHARATEGATAEAVSRQEQAPQRQPRREQEQMQLPPTETPAPQNNRGGTIYPQKADEDDVFGGGHSHDANGRYKAGAQPTYLWPQGNGQPFFPMMMPDGTFGVPYPMFQPHQPTARIETKDLPHFNGFEDKDGVERFVRAIDVHLKTGVSEHQITARLGTLLHGTASEWFHTLTDEELSDLQSWAQWRPRLIETFRPANIRILEQQAAAHRIIRTDEDVRRYFHEKKNLLRRGNPSMSDSEIGLHILGGTPIQWRANVTWDPERDTLHDLQTAMERRAGLLHAQWWDPNLDMRDQNGHPRPGFISWLSDLSKSSNSRAPKATKSASQNQNQQQQRSQRDNSNQNSSDGNGSYGNHTEEYKRRWLNNQRKYLGHEPFRPYPPSRPCKTCGGKHYDEDCDKANQSQEGKGQANQRSPSTGANATAATSFHPTNQQ